MSTTKGSTMILLGQGQLTWGRGERVTDRYGAVWLHDGPLAKPTTDFAEAPIGEHGRLVATVLENRRSEHIGDIFRGIRPPGKPPAVGSYRILGEGVLFKDDAGEGVASVGIRPTVERESDWLDPHVLYALHDQTVRLEFLPTAAP